MSTKSGIEWTDATWNPLRGCSRVSEGCRNCYAETVANRFCGPGSPYEGVVQIGADGKGNGKWNGQIKFVEKRLLDPLRWKEPRRIFVNSMSDLFHEGVTDEQLDRIFAVMAMCPQHAFQVLTKRPARMLVYLSSEVSRTRILRQIERLVRAGVACKGLGWRESANKRYAAMDAVTSGPLPNVRLGVSVENQAAADRLDPLCELDAYGWKTMVSFEPLLSYVFPGLRWLGLGARTWAIVGGESGPKARPMHPDWARGLRDQCVAAGVPFFFKQWGEWIPHEMCSWEQSEGCENGEFHRATASGGTEFIAHCLCSEGDPNGNMRRVGKKAAGDLLDGVQWHQFPEVRA